MSQTDLHFEIGKHYQHSSGKRIYICGIAKTHIYGWALIGEDPHGNLTPVGSAAEHAENWHIVSADNVSETAQEILHDSLPKHVLERESEYRHGEGEIEHRKYQF